MTQPTPIPPGQDTSDDVIQVRPQPFPDADSFELTKDVNRVQLNDELQSALGASLNIAISETDPNFPISDSNPAVLYISPSGQNQTKVYATINAHIRYDAYDVPAADRQYSSVVQNVVDDIGYSMTNEELQIAVKGLLLKQNTAAELTLDQQLPPNATA